MNTPHTLKPLLERIGNKLYDLRHARREKLETVAVSVGVTHPVISQVERGVYECLSLELLCKLADYYGVAPEFLFMGETINYNL